MEQIRLDVIPKGLMPVCHASQYDKGRVIRFNLMDGLQPFTLDGTETLEVDVRKTDMNIVTAAVTNTSSSYVEIITTEQMTACEGDNLGELKITKGDVVIASLNFILRVEEDPLKDGIESETEINNLEHQVAAIVSEQYDSENVIFDSEPTSDHGNGYTVTSEGIKSAIDAKPDNLSDLGDVNISSPTSNQALVWDDDAQKWTNGEVSTVGNLDDLSDVDTTGKQEGDSLRYIGNEWKAKPTTVEMTKAEYDAIVDFTPYANTHIVITDAPNLNATASDIEYTSGVSVKQAIDGIVESGSNANGNYIKYADGTMICTKSEAIEILQSQWVAWGTMQNVGGVSVGSWAETFYSTPIVNATISGDSAWLEKITNFTTTSCGTVGFVRPNNPGRTTNFNVQIVAIGRWKA